MDLHKMITELRLEKERLDEAILALERLVAGKTRRRGRPARWLTGELERQVHTLDQPGAQAVSETN
jgi:hypothetical protein